MSPDKASRGRDILIAILLLALAVMVVITVRTRRAPAMTIVDPHGVLREVRLLKELVTVRYSIQKVTGLRQDAVPFGSESILLIVQARVLGGIDLGDVSDSDVTLKDNHSVAVRLPPPQVLHVYLDEKNTQVWDRSKTWWTPWVPYDVNLEKKARLAALDAVKQESIDMGILRDAQSSAETMIRELLHNLGLDHVEFQKKRT